MDCGVVLCFFFFIFLKQLILFVGYSRIGIRFESTTKATTKAFQPTGKIYNVYIIYERLNWIRLFDFPLLHIYNYCYYSFIDFNWTLMQIPAAAMLIQCLWRCYAADKSFRSTATWTIYVKDSQPQQQAVATTPLSRVCIDRIVFGRFSLNCWKFYFKRLDFYLSTVKILIWAWVKSKTKTYKIEYLVKQLQSILISSTYKIFVFNACHIHFYDKILYEHIKRLIVWGLHNMYCTAYKMV